MNTAGVVARLVLAGVFAAAATSKLTDLASFGGSVRELGVPDRFVPALRRAVPALEATIAVGALFTPTAAGALGAAGLLLVAFTALLGWNLASGRRPACNCFGSASDEPISGWSLVRNSLLIAVTAVGLWESHLGTSAWIEQHLAGKAAVSLASWLLGALTLVTASAFALVRSGSGYAPRVRRLLRSRSSVTSESSGLVPGTAVDDLRLRDRAGIVPDDVPILVVRTDPECGPCRALLPRLLSWQSTYAGLLEFVVLTGATEAEDGDVQQQVHHLVTDAPSVAEALGLDVTPSAVLVGADDRVASSVAAGAIEIGALVSDAARGGGSALVQGDPATGVVMASPQGLVSIADVAGRMTLLVFWDPWCHFCRRALIDLLQWQERAAASGQSLLIAGQRDDEVARLQGFDLVGADLDGSIMRLFGGDGTPSAVLIDATGRIASDIAHGADQVMAIAKRADLLASLRSAHTA